ncbi:C40 family peptidase [Lentilactobacillus sunkii]|uniref:NLP P60 protein n=1 Tax=Lentilactobacillus sunkii DSM 19904 TaxID=1423808 RepID=A0A0R1KWR2_9LACO|nr:C40 family peptidase [Lentilactobacillus sunkii]KRK88011.1 NLP P60 protein [Lentilactobacillus sunkii DSM 19904]
MKLSKTILSFAVAGAIMGGAVTTASADTYNNAGQNSYNTSYNQSYNDQNSYNTGYNQNYNGQTSSNNTYNQNYSGQTTTTASTTTANSTTSSKADAVVSLAKQLATQNIPYVWGGESLNGMDCSGLTDYVYQKAAGISLGHYTVTQESHVTKKAVSAAQPGDLLFWGNEGASYHVAIYIGNNQYVAAPQPGQNVEVETINSAFMPSFAGHVNG